MARRTSLSTHGIDDVEQTWQEVVPSAQLRTIAESRVRFDWVASVLEGTAVLSYQLGAGAGAEIEPRDQLVFCRVDAPRGRLATATGTRDLSRPWVSCEAPLQVSWEGHARVSALVFDREFAEPLARQIVGDDRLVLRVHEIVPGPDDARKWERVYRHVMLSMGDTGTEVATLGEAELRRHALVSSLLAFDTSFRRAADASAQRRGAPASVRRATSFIESHAGDPVTVDDIARAARMSTRGLQAAFRRELGTTPAAYLRRVRLAGAREELEHHDRAPIAQISARWGFATPSRFAAAYRAEYGMTPRQTPPAR